MAIVFCDSNLCRHWNKNGCMREEILLEHNDNDDFKCLSFKWGPNYFLGI